ncbi:hypothetical protein P3W85_07510 [Cupriavidus basilensis]|uniref:YXWGXW repeat-containing protein n=1 Tax=Cupriavidus basilensis TaxID=68895 RepID=A0ABT6AJK0_9BURK|nr:hypothetical protein [Cupriavidus basilensis]MDF3832791.1 hypothetical protein [Cupriavidus basilensis]
MRKVLLCAVAAAGLAGGLGAAPCALAQVSVNVSIGVPPPAPVYEVVPVARPGYVWAPGYWDWDDRGHKHKWKKGRWERARAGYIYEAPRWIHARDGWMLQPERWEGRGDGRPGRGYKGYHCPPGHAKKGEC